MNINFGPIDVLLRDENVTEIMVNSWDKIFVEANGSIVETSERFTNEPQFMQLVDLIIEKMNTKRGAAGLYFDGVLPQGYRYNITLPPMSPKGASLTIRKFSSKVYSLVDLVHMGALSEQAGRFLEASVKARASIVVSGGTGTGKTTILNSLSRCIPTNQRVVTIEDVPELRLPVKNWVSLVTLDQPHSVSTRDCLVNSLRMRPDRIIVGECRRDETFEMLQAMNSGHAGSMTTVHANTAPEALTRIESLLFFTNIDLPIKVMRYQISEAIDIIVQLRRSPNGKREISEIIELTGLEGDVITRAPIFERNDKNEMVMTGYVPTVIEKMKAAGVSLPPDFFNVPGAGAKTPRKAK